MTNPTPPDASPEMTVEDACLLVKEYIAYAHAGSPHTTPKWVAVDHQALEVLLTAFERQQAVVEAARKWRDGEWSGIDLNHIIDKYRSTATEER